MNGIRVLACVIVSIAAAPPLRAQSLPDFKLAFLNIQGGNGEQALPGHVALFTENTNCTDPSRPLNAWGVGLVQRELRARLADDPDVIALGLAEAWGCATSERVRRELGWARRSTETRSGLALVARHGFAAPEQWLQLDTSLNADVETRWILRVPVCANPACSASVLVFATHWGASGPYLIDSVARQAQGTVEFMAREAGGAHVLIADLNVFEGSSTVCGQTPINGVLSTLRAAGYVDAWQALHGDSEGYTGMLNRRGCGVPEGYAWKRIDYAWSRGHTPAAMSRFGIVAPGDGAISDHYGIVTRYAAGIGSTADRRDVILRAGAASLAGAWRLEPDTQAAGGTRVRHPNAGAPRIAAPLPLPRDYVELTFDADAGVPYRLWLRGRADADSWANDSVYVQFDGSVSQLGAPVYRIGSSSATTVTIEEGLHALVSGWGWADNGYGIGVLGPTIYFAATGRQRIRIQTREDGLAIDQVVVSAGRYLTLAPGATKQDATILR